VAVDTETVNDVPWSVQYADVDAPNGIMVYCSDMEGMARVHTYLESPSTLTILHNARYDLRVLAQCGIHPARYECTMQMAYLLGEPRISLKTLAYRLVGMEMRTYEEVTAEATQVKARAYLEWVMELEWPDPEPIMRTDGAGVLKLSFPKNIKGKVGVLLRKADADPTIDLYAKWYAMEADKGRAQVENTLGSLKRAFLNEVDTEVAERYALLDAEATYAIYPHLHAAIVELGLQPMLEMDMGILPMIGEMEDNGVQADVSVLEELGRDLDMLSEGVQADINYMARHYVNPRSSQQVAALLQDRGIYTVAETSTDAKVLDKYREHAMVGKIQDYRAYSKLQSTYVAGLAKRIREDGRIHTTFSTTRTETGRLASSKPNLQNLPVRTELGRRIRATFVSATGCSFMALDLSQIELRIAAHMSQDQTMLDIYWHDGDIHMTTACAMFGLPPERIDDKAHRRPAKTCNFGTIYLISAEGLWTQFQHEGLVQFTVDDCQDFLDSWRRTYPGFFEWVEEVKGEARRTGMVRDMFGRIRWVPELQSSLSYVREAGIRQAVNAPIQAGAGGVLKMAMGRLTPIVNQWQNDYGVVCRPLLQIHDELIFEVEDEYIPIMAPQFHEVMCSSVELSVPLRADVEVGKNWRDLKAYAL